jgi:hypothetical protein
MPIGAAKATRKRKVSHGNAALRQSGSGEGGGGPTSYGRDGGAKGAGYGKQPEPAAAPRDGYVVKQKARNT